MSRVKCGATFIGRWTGTTYTCNLTAPHLHHRGVCSADADELEWPNDRDYCASPFPGSNDICKRPPNHPGPCRVKIHGKTVTYRIRRQ